MTTQELLQNIQYTINQDGHVTAVVVSFPIWQRLLMALEHAEDQGLVQALHTKLLRGPQASGTLRWDDVAGEWS